MKLENAQTKLKKSSRDECGRKARILDDSPKVLEGVNRVKTGQLTDLHRILVREMDLHQGEAVWLDAHNISSTYKLSKESDCNILDRLRISRAFTPYQHYEGVRSLEDHVTDSTNWLVVSGPAKLYLEGQINKWDAEELFTEAWNILLDLQKEYSLKVIVDDPKKVNSLTSQIKEDSDNFIEFNRDGKYTKRSSKDFETFLYRKNGFVQTTIPFWEGESLVS